MTEAEHLLVMNEYINTSFMLVSVLLSLVSAFLLVSYLASDKFNTVVAGVLVVMYSAAYFWIGGATIDANLQVLAFTDKMRASGIDFSWARFMNLDEKVFFANAMVVLAGYVASLFFFFYLRHQQAHGRRATSADL
jgi:hypothetical protein